MTVGTLLRSGVLGRGLRLPYTLLDQTGETPSARTSHER